MKKILSLVLMMMSVTAVFAIDLNKVGQLFDKSIDIAITELDNLKDFDIPKAEDVEAKVNNEMYISELESKVKQLEAEVRLLKKENSRLKNLLKIYELKEDDENESYFFGY